jgi:ornithine carbamoyltransferase
VDTEAIKTTEQNPETWTLNPKPLNQVDTESMKVIDGPQSVVFDQAENRLHAQKALITSLINGFGWRP